MSGDAEGLSEEALHRFFDRSPAGMFRAREDGSFVYVNPAFARMLGYSTDELMKLNLGRDVYADADDRTALIRDNRKTGVVDGVRLRWRARSGRALTILLWGHLTASPAGDLFDGTVLDVTANEAANARLEHQREELERTARILDLVVRQMPAMYWVLDRDLRVVRTGGVVEEVLGYPRDQFVGVLLRDVHRADPGSVDPVAFHERALRGDTVSYDTIYRGKDLATTVAPYYTVDGELVGAIGTAVDVTLPRQLERRMIDAQRAESLGVLASGLAHDFNNLLVAVIGNADLGMREIPVGAPGRNTIQNIRDAGMRAAELTEQLLAFAGRGGAGSGRVVLAPIVSELLRIVAASLPPELHVSNDVPTTLAVRADESQLRQVLLNLLSNARDALGGRGHIALRARVIRHDGAPSDDDVLPTSPGSYVLFEISDDGPGMDRERRRHVFEPFYTTKDRGHGLGLAAVLGIVRAHGGGIRLSSEPGAGATFQILWPAAATAPHAAPVPPQLDQGGRTVLVVDDEDMVRDVVARMIQDLGYVAVTAPTGADALAVVDRQEVDAVLVDLTMPNMNGADVIAALRSRRPTMPIVMCSGYDRDHRSSVTADAYLAKPFRIDALAQTLRELVPLRNV